MGSVGCVGRPFSKCPSALGVLGRWADISARSHPFFTFFFHAKNTEIMRKTRWESKNGHKECNIIASIAHCQATARQIDGEVQDLIARRQANENHIKKLQLENVHIDMDLAPLRHAYNEALDKGMQFAKWSKRLYGRAHVTAPSITPAEKAGRHHPSPITQ